VSKTTGPAVIGWLLAALAAATVAGCWNGAWFGSGADTVVQQQIPAPINYLLPKQIRFHPFTGTRTFDEAGGIKGIDVRVEALDPYGDRTKAFGVFRFELYEFRPNNADPKGRRITTWQEDLLDPKKNRVHWDDFARAYEFKLQWDEAIPVGRRFVLAVVFSSPFTQRIFAQRVFVSGQ